MIDQLHLLRDELSFLKNTLSKIKARHLNRADLKENVRTLIGNYFRNYRPIFIGHISSEESLLSVDEEMQNLLRLTQGRALVEQYKATINKLARSVNQLEIIIVSQPIEKRMPASQISSRDEKIIKTLEKLVPGACSSYRQGLMDLKDSTRISWRGAAVEFREALRETLDHLAPDKTLSKKEGFQLEAGAKKPTMKQKMVFILSSREKTKSAREAPKKLFNIIDEMMGGLFRSVYDRASASTHVPTSREEVQNIKNYVEILLSELLELPEE